MLMSGEKKTENLFFGSKLLCGLNRPPPPAILAEQSFAQKLLILFGNPLDIPSGMDDNISIRVGDNLKHFPERALAC